MIKYTTLNYSKDEDEDATVAGLLYFYTHGYSPNDPRLPIWSSKVTASDLKEFAPTATDIDLQNALKTLQTAGDTLDFDNNGEINMNDAMYLRNYIIAIINNRNADYLETAKSSLIKSNLNGTLDFDEDGDIDFDDVMYVYNFIKKYPQKNSLWSEITYKTLAFIENDYDHYGEPFAEGQYRYVEAAVALKNFKETAKKEFPYVVIINDPATNIFSKSSLFTLDFDKDGDVDRADLRLFL